MKPALVLACVAALAAPPALAQNQVYVPSMGSSSSAPLPTTRTPGPQVYVPESGRVGPDLRFPGRIEARKPRRDRTRSATVPTPRAPYAGRIEVPDRVRPGETSQDRIARCSHYGALYGARNQGAYVHNCAFGN